jgi:hypothetical protein
MKPVDDNAYKAEIEKLQKIIGKQAIQIEILKKPWSCSEKIESVRALSALGYAVKDVFHALEMSRSGYYRRSLRRKMTIIPMVREQDLSGRIKVGKAYTSTSPEKSCPIITGRYIL